VSSDGLTAIVAGSDTTAMTLTGLFHFLIKNREAYDRLQAEIDAAFPKDAEPLDMVKMANMPFLNACM
jgi:cytochrome P450